MEVVGSVEQFFISWFIHTIALLLFMVITSAVILRFHEFFVGCKPEQHAEESVPFYVVMTVLIAAVSIFSLSHCVPSGDYDDY
jgi:hypothetical protein